MRWLEHILESDKSLVKALNLRLGALKKIYMASFKTRKSIANGIFMSKLIYLMPLWSGCEEYLVNKAARTVARMNIFTPTKTLMKACGGCLWGSCWPTTAWCSCTRQWPVKHLSIFTRRLHLGVVSHTRQDKLLPVLLGLALLLPILQIVELLDKYQAPN